MRADNPPGLDGGPRATGEHHALRNAFAVGEGSRPYRWFNCSVCHGLGGGGNIGPALSDMEWRYGGSPRDVRHSIAHGRTNGMPAYSHLVNDDQLWQLTAFVLSLSGRLPVDVAPGRNDGISVGEPPVMRSERHPVPERTLP